jgi:hypothetical protein
MGAALLLLQIGFKVIRYFALCALIEPSENSWSGIMAVLDLKGGVPRG